VFAVPADYRYYLETLVEFKEALGMRVYAFCLMTNHVHLLLAPDTQAGLGRLMKRLAGRQTRYHNCAEGRRGTLWEGRYKSSPVQADSYFLACIRYIELNPVRARMVVAPEQYPWSSFQRWGEHNPYMWLDPLPCAIGGDELSARRYRDFMREAIPGGEWDLIRESVQRGQLTGNARFVDEVERIIGKRIEQRRPGRPTGEK
jgi:putative transposase